MSELKDELEKLLGKNFLVHFVENGQMREIAQIYPDFREKFFMTMSSSVFLFNMKILNETYKKEGVK